MEDNDDMTVAWSLDGLAFRSSGPLRDGLPLGGYVRIVVPDGTIRLGQVLEQVLDQAVNEAHPLADWAYRPPHTHRSTPSRHVRLAERSPGRPLPPNE